MQQGKIRVAATIDNDGDCRLFLKVSKLDVKAECAFWGHPDQFKDYADALKSFPRSLSDCVVTELGEEQRGSCQPYLLLKASCYDDMGHTVLQVITNNNLPLPYAQRLEFCIEAEAASLNQLGVLLAHWDIEQTPEVVWEARIS
ncbi:hypothetical protein ASU33_05350 [Solirubrum puertoriconensis]|uniref:Uncharacterized protein n=1 Tax=Solirubrum puertoriconensis TaxID=1751427 RepID=A0A9X0L3P7_SOLP1|nr:hypothetical protein ASU33_05350 [Solirubrum puertoriconensis]